MVYNLHMHIEALSQALNFYDIRDVFQIILENTVEYLGVELANVFTCQEEFDYATDELQLKSGNNNFLVSHTRAKKLPCKISCCT